MLNTQDVDVLQLRAHYRYRGYSPAQVEELVRLECEHRQWMREFNHSIVVYDAVFSATFAALGLLLCAVLLFAVWPAPPHWTAGIAGIYTGIMLGNLVRALRQLGVPRW